MIALIVLVFLVSMMLKEIDFLIIWMLDLSVKYFPGINIIVGLSILVYFILWLICIFELKVKGFKMVNIF